MAKAVRRAEYFKVDAANKAGEATRMLDVLRDAGVNLLAFSGFPRGRRAQIDFVPARAAAFTKAAQKAKWKIKGPKMCFLFTGADRPGAVDQVLSKLAKAKINVTAVQAACAGNGRYGAILWVKPGHVKRAARALGA